MMRNPARVWTTRKREIVAACYYDLPADPVEQGAGEQ